MFATLGYEIVNERISQLQADAHEAHRIRSARRLRSARRAREKALRICGPSAKVTPITSGLRN
jgi:hypothetical protein